ncbi:hypothetical protein GQ53DRAFT_757602 [Thozetella sp. PMI_491]|nr:hypothetical protein GQ53DRAFT_757602 [Thozetella sp. PMI_491]
MALAAMQKGSDLIELLAQYGGLINHRYRHTIHYAARGGYAGIVALLMENGADIHHRAAEPRSTTALECAAREGRLDTVQLLLSTGAFDHSQDELNYATVLARSNGHFGVVHLLKQHMLETNNEIVEHHDSEGYSTGDKKTGVFSPRFMYMILKKSREINSLCNTMHIHATPYGQKIVYYT